MRDEEIRDEYFDWMCELIFDSDHFIKNSYQNLLRHLNNLAFTPNMNMDENRYQDGLYLRYRFAYEHSIEDEIVESCVSGPCSILEMMIALAQRTEEDIMMDDDLGSRIPEWFWNMIDNLGLSGQDDSNYDFRQVEHVIYIFNKRLYDRNGAGGLFITHDSKCDMRELEIWYQMNKYLNEIE